MSRLFPVCAVALLALALAVPAAAETKVAVIDVQRVVTESDPGKEALKKLNEMRDAKVEQGRGLREELEALKDRLSKQRFTLAEDKVDELSREIEDKGIALKRFEDDAMRSLNDEREKILAGLEQRIMPIISQLGTEQGFTLIFNKFQSGLVYADDAVDITDEVIRRFNLAP